MASSYIQLHPKINQELGKVLRDFAEDNGITANQAITHVLTLGLKEMHHQFGGSLMHYLKNIRLKDQEIH